MEENMKVNGRTLISMDMEKLNSHHRLKDILTLSKNLENIGSKPMKMLQKEMLIMIIYLWVNHLYPMNSTMKELDLLKNMFLFPTQTLKFISNLKQK